jgi:hypothetical protein
LLVGQMPTALGKLLEFENPGLVGIDQTSIGLGQSSQADLDLPLGGLFLSGSRLSTGGEPLELCCQLNRIAQECDDVLPDGLL